MVLEISNVLVSMDIFTECFCCDLEKCKGACCVEGDAGAPVKMDEIAAIEEAAETAWDKLSARAQAVIDHQGVVYSDPEGDLVTSIVNGKDCVFTYHTAEGCCLCALESACREDKTPFRKPISCSLYPIREKRLRNGMSALSYHQWDICKDARERGRELRLPLYKFLAEPLVRRFGAAWYQELLTVASELKRQRLI